MDTQKALLGVMATIGIALAGALWWTNDERQISDTSSDAPAAGSVSSPPSQKAARIPSAVSTVSSTPMSTAGQDAPDASSPASVDPMQAADLRKLIHANRIHLLDTATELRARIADLRADAGAEPISDQELLRWAGALYRDAILARIAHGEPEPSEKDTLRDALALTQPTLNPQVIPEPLPSAEDGYGRYLQQLLRTLPRDDSEITGAQALDLALKIQGLLQRRKRHSDNLFLSDVRSVVLDANRSVPARIAYVQQFFEVGDNALGQYGSALLADIPDRESLSQADRQAILRVQARVRKEKSQ